MKKLYTVFVALLLCANLFAQAPQKINYQAVARNASGIPLINQNIGVRISILDGSVSGTAVYVETHSITTNNLGLFNLAIGGGTPQTGTFNIIDWGKFSQVYTSRN